MPPLRIVVCVKPVPDPKHWDRVELDPVSGALRRAGIPSVINPLDRNAIEAAIQLKTGEDDTVTLVSMAPPEARDTLLQGVAMGADAAVLVTDRKFAGADTLATSYAVAKAITKLGGADIVLCGVDSIDGSTGQVGPQVAENLGFEHITRVSQIVGVTEGRIRVESDFERWHRIIEADLPILLTVTKDANSPRYVSLSGLLDAQDKEITQWSAEDIGAEDGLIGVPGSACAVESMFVPESSRKREVLEGTTEEAIDALFDKMKAAGVL